MKMKNRAALSASFPELPPEYIDPEISGMGRQILETFYKACLSEGGTADEIHLRGVLAVIDQWCNICPIPEDVRTLCATAYQVVGAAEGPVELLDNLSAAANGDSLPHAPDSGLPWMPVPPGEGGLTVPFCPASIVRQSALPQPWPSSP